MRYGERYPHKKIGEVTQVTKEEKQFDGEEEK